MVSEVKEIRLVSEVKEIRLVSEVKEILSQAINRSMIKSFPC